jgi:hypothetical protein
MNKTQNYKLIQVLIRTSVFFILLGAFSKILHYSNGNLIFWFGFAAWFLLNGIKTIHQRTKKNDAIGDRSKMSISSTERRLWQYKK